MKRFLIVNLAVAVVAFLPTFAAGQESVSLQRLLDRPVSVEAKDLPIGKIFEKLQAASGIEFIVDHDTLDVLPYGDQTRLSARIKNATLRTALTPILSVPALQWEIVGEKVRIIPSEPLYRMCRRATYDELLLLGKMHTEKVTPAEGEDALQAIKRTLGAKDLDIFFHTKDEQDVKDKAFKRAASALPGTAVAYFDRLCHGNGWTWYLSGDRVMIRDKVSQNKRQLEKQITLKYTNAELVTVLADLAHASRLKLTMKPGVLQYLSDEVKSNFNLTMSEASVAEALEVISGATGLIFKPTEDGLLVDASEELVEKGTRGGGSRNRSPFFVKLSVPGPNGTIYEVFLRSDELPEDVVKAIEAEKQKFIDSVRKNAEPNTEKTE